MANTRTSTKRARQALTRQARNQTVRGATRTALTHAINAVKTAKSADVEKVKAAYQLAIKTLAKAASKGAIPKGRAARKISRLTLLAKKTVPAAFSTSKR